MAQMCNLSGEDLVRQRGMYMLYIMTLLTLVPSMILLFMSLRKIGVHNWRGKEEEEEINEVLRRCSPLLSRLYSVNTVTSK